MISFAYIFKSARPPAHARAFTAVQLAALALASVLPAWSADHSNLDEGLPTQVEDAYPVAFRSREIQAVFTYESTQDSEDRVIMEPRLEFGVLPNTQLTLHVPFYSGNADRSGSGDVGLGVLYNFNTETLVLPALALAAEADLPSGKDSHGVDTTLKLIVTKTVSASGLDRVHFNLEWKRNASPEADERKNHYVGILGYSRRIGPDTILVADYVREEAAQEDEAANIVELGVRRQLTPLTVLSVGVGAGLGEDSPDFRATFGLQRSF